MSNTFAQMDAFLQQHQDEMVAEKEVTQPGVTLTNKVLPRYRLYHFLKYDNQGRVINYHEDHFSTDINGLYMRLKEVYGPTSPFKGLPIRGQALPPDATKPSRDVKCLFPGCPYGGPSREHLRLHMQAKHADFSTELESRERIDERQAELSAMREQARAMTALAEGLQAVLRNQGMSNSPAATAMVDEAKKIIETPARVGWRGKNKDEEVKEI